MHIINFDGEHNIDCVEINDDYLIIDYLDDKNERWKVDEDGIINTTTTHPEVFIFNELEDMNLLCRRCINGEWRWMIVKEEKIVDIQQPIIFKLPFGQGFYAVHPYKKIALFLEENAIFPRRINFSHFDCEELNDFGLFFLESQSLKTGFWSCWLGSQ